MPGVVHASIPDASRLEQCLPFRPVSMSTDRTAVGLAPDKIAVFPCRPGDQAFFQLGGAVRPECRHQLWRKRDRSHGDSVRTCRANDPGPSPSSQDLRPPSNHGHAPRDFAFQDSRPVPRRGLCDSLIYATVATAQRFAVPALRCWAAASAASASLAPGHSQSPLAPVARCAGTFTQRSHLYRSPARGRSRSPARRGRTHH